MPRGGGWEWGEGGGGSEEWVPYRAQCSLEVSVADVQGFKIIFALKLSHHLF